MIHLPFEDRIVFVGGRWDGEKPEHIKECRDNGTIDYYVEIWWCY